MERNKDRKMSGRFDNLSGIHFSRFVKKIKCEESHWNEWERKPGRK